MPEFLRWMLAKLGTQEAAGWAQAIGTVAAIGATWFVAQRQRADAIRDRNSERNARQRGLAISILRPLTQWHSTVARAMSDGAGSFNQLTRDNLLFQTLGAPESIEEILPMTGDLGAAGVHIQKAAFLVKWLSDKRDQAWSANTGQLGDQELNQEVWHAYLAKGDELQVELYRALQEVHHMFR